MPKQAITFGDGLQRIVADLAQMELDPNADRALIGELRETIITYQQSIGQQQAPAAGPDFGPGAIPGTLEIPEAEPPMDPMGGMPLPVPTTDADMSRGPRPGIDTTGAAEELQRLMSGA